MGAAAIPLMIGLTVASTAFSIKSSMDAGKVASAEAKIASKREGDAARGREIERRRALLRALSSQNATAGAGGVDPNMAIAGADIQYAADDILTDKSNTKSTQALLKLQGANAVRAGRAEAFTSLLDGGAKVAGLSVGPPKKASVPKTGTT